jgi:hypothetical protein
MRLLLRDEEKTGSPLKTANITIISQGVSPCLFSFLLIFGGFSYGLYHLEKSRARGYDKDTKGVSPMY